MKRLLPLLLLVAAVGASPLSARDLIGVWVAQRDFGPSATSSDRKIREDFWIQPPGSAGPPYAIPARFLGGLPDFEHFFLVISMKSDGSVQAFLRNPERNVGAAIGTRSLATSGNVVRLQRAGAADTIGQIDEMGRLHFQLAGLPGDFIFERPKSAAELSAFYPRAGGHTYAYHQPAELGDGWRTGTLHEAGLDGKTIGAFMQWIMQTPTDSLAAPYIQSVQIERHGRLVLDEYFYGFDARRPHDVRSAGKSVTTLLVGAAIGDGSPIRPDSRVTPLFASYAPFANDDVRKERLTVANLMAMSSGLACDDNDDNSPGNEDVMQSQKLQPDWYKYTLDLPMLYEPGTRAIYCSAGINLLGGIVAHVTGKWLPQYFSERFAAPMQFGLYGMWLTSPPPQTAYMAGGDFFRPRDFLKFGQLFLDHGRWNGARIIAERWLRDSAQPRSAPEGEGDQYGYGWHILTYHAGSRVIRAIVAGGNGGQLLIVLPQLDMAAMITAGSYGQFRVWRAYGAELVPKYIIGAALK